MVREGRESGGRKVLLVVVGVLQSEGVSSQGLDEVG